MTHVVTRAGHLSQEARRASAEGRHTDARRLYGQSSDLYGDYAVRALIFAAACHGMAALAPLMSVILR